MTPDELEHRIARYARIATDGLLISAGIFFALAIIAYLWLF